MIKMLNDIKKYALIGIEKEIYAVKEAIYHWEVGIKNCDNEIHLENMKRYLEVNEKELEYLQKLREECLKK